MQNQISDGVIESNVNAIVMGEELDAGDVYCSLSVTLQGSLSGIWLSIADRAYELIQKCIISQPVPTPQRGALSTYKRIKNNEINLNKTNDFCYIYDQIRMVDAEGYPNAHLRINDFKLEFTRAQLNNNSIISDVRITKE
jgi:methionyl-tRNA formyltransferase